MTQNSFKTLLHEISKEKDILIIIKIRALFRDSTLKNYTIRNVYIFESLYKIVWAA